MKHLMNIAKDDRFFRIYFVSILFVHVIFFTVAMINKNFYLADSFEYLHQNKNLLTHFSWYCCDFSKEIELNCYSKRPPLYGIFITLPKLIWNSEIPVFVFQNILSLLTFVVLYKLIGNYNFSYKTKLFLLVLILLYPGQFIYTSLIMPEILMQFLIIMTLYSFVKFLKKRDFASLIIYNLFLSAALLTKPVLLYFVIINVLVLIIVFYKYKLKTLYISAALLPVIVVLVISSINYSNTGYFHYSSSKKTNLLYYHAYFVLTHKHGEKIANEKLTEILAEINDIDDYKVKSKREEEIAMNIIFDNFNIFILKHFGGMVNYYMDPGRFDLLNFIGVQEPNHTGMMYAYAKDGYVGIVKFILDQPLFVVIWVACILIINVILTLSMIGFLFARVDIELKIFVFSILIYMSLLSGAIASARYRLHVYPIILFTVPFFYENVKCLVKKIKTNSKLNRI